MNKLIKRIALILAIVFSISVLASCDLLANISGDGSDSSPAAVVTSSSSNSQSSDVTPEAFSYLGETYGPHINSLAEFSAFYQYAIFYQIGKVQLYLDFLGSDATNDSVASAINSVKADVTFTYSCKTAYGCVNKNEKLWQFEFSNWTDNGPNNTTKTNYPTDSYTPIVNLVKYTSSDENKRAETFNGFAINEITKTASVTTSEQLYYVVSKGVKPVPTQGSVAETIYSRAKQVLREVVDDTMSDAEKVIAICDWLSENVSYDNKMVELSDGGTDTKRYNAHYLEGVFVDNRAVCDGFSKAFVLFTRIEGIESIMIEGVAGGGAHAWNKVNIPYNENDCWYIVDNTWNNSGTSGDFDGEVPGNENYELWTRAYTLVTENAVSATHNEKAGAGYPIAAGGNPEVDVYNSIKYDGTASLKITSREELKNVLTWIKIKITSDELEDVRFAIIDLNVTYNYGSNFGNEVSEVSTLNMIWLNTGKIRFGSTVGKQYMIFLL